MTNTDEIENDPDPGLTLPQDGDRIPKEPVEPYGHLSIAPLRSVWETYLDVRKTAKPAKPSDTRPRNAESSSKRQAVCEKWQDLFLCRVIDDADGQDWQTIFKKPDEENYVPADEDYDDLVIKVLVEDFMTGLHNLCVHFDAYKDSVPLRKYLFNSRGWKILTALCKIEQWQVERRREASYSSSVLSRRVVVGGKITSVAKSPYHQDFIDLLMHLFQLTFSEQLDEPNSNEESSTADKKSSSLHYWRETSSSSNNLDQNPFIRSVISGQVNDVLDLWASVEQLYHSNPSSSGKISPEERQKSFKCRKSKTRRATKMSGSKSYAGGFPDYKPIQRKDVDKLGMTPQITERQFMAVSTDSEGMDQTDALLFDSKLGGPSNAVVKPIQSNPMDFEYFEKVVRSDDEARQQVSWRKNPVKRRFSHSKSADPVKRVIRARGPRHEEIMETSVSQGTFACIVLATLRIACAKEIRIQNHIKKPIARTLGSSLILATFSVDCAKNLREEKQSKCLTTRENHIIYLLLIKLMATSLVEVQFTPAFDSLLQNTDLISTLLQRVVDGVSGTEAVLELLDDSTTKLNSLNESIRLCTLMLCVMKNLHRTCEKVHKKRRIQPHFIICDRLCANNGMATVGKVLELVTSQPTLEMMSGMDRLLVEVSAFIGAVGVCEVALVESPCSSKTMEQLMTFSASLMRHLLDVVQKCKTCGQDLGLANMLLDGLLSAKKQFCVHPYVAWEYLLHVAIFAEEVEELRTKSFSLLEILIGHFFTAHPEVSVSTIVRKYPQIRLCTVSSNSPTDSDSAFYASDPGEAESSAGDKSSEHNHLTLYRTLLSSSLKTVVRQTLYHLIKLTHISPWKLRLQIFVVVVLPTLEDLSLNLAEEDGLKDLKTYTVQKLFFITETLMKEREVFVYCRCKKQFLKTLLAFKVDPNLCDYAYRCAFTFLSSEIRRCLRNLSLDSFTTSTPLLSTSAEEFDLVSLFDEHVSQVVKAFSSNPTIRDALTSLETGTENMLSDRDLEFRQLKDVCAMWRLQTSLAQVFNDYAEYLGQRKKDMSLALALVNLLLSRLNDDQDNHKLIVTTVGSIVQLFVELSNTMTRKRESEKHTARYMFLECLVSLEEFILAGTKSQSLTAENFNVVVHMLLNAGVKKESSEETKVKNVSIALQTYTVPEVKIESDAYFPEDSDEQSDNEVVKDGKKVSRAIVSKELVNLTIRLLISFAANPVVTKYDSVVIDGLSRLTEVCCGKEEKNKAILDELCANSIILAELPKILTKDNPLVQEVVLNLLINQAQFRLSRDELHSFINFFKTNFSEGQSSDSVRIMLRGLDDIVTANSRKLQPKTFAEFPTACTKQEEDLKSARHSGATAFVLPFSTGDPLFSLTCKTEASVSLWFTMDSDFKSSSEKYHMVSLGSQMLMLEVWLDKTSIQVQIVSSVSEPEKVGSATFLLAEILDTAKKMPFERWTHLVLSCSSKSESAEIQIFLNTIGSKKLTVSLKDIAVQLQHQAKTINAEMCKQTVIVGHKTSKHEDPKYRIGKAVLVFNSFNCDENCAAALYFLDRRAAV